MDELWHRIDCIAVIPAACPLDTPCTTWLRTPCTLTAAYSSQHHPGLFLLSFIPLLLVWCPTSASQLNPISRMSGSSSLMSQDQGSRECFSDSPKLFLVRDQMSYNIPYFLCPSSETAASVLSHSMTKSGHRRCAVAWVLFCGTALPCQVRELSVSGNGNLAELWPLLCCGCWLGSRCSACRIACGHAQQFLLHLQVQRWRRGDDPAPELP